MIFNKDCRNLTKWDGDVLITDPPYRAHVHKSAASQSLKKGTTSRDFGFDHLSASLRRWTCRLAATVPRWSVIFTDVESAGWWRIGLECAGAQYIRTIPWVRWSMPQLSGDRPPSGCELIVLAHGKAKKHWNGPGSLTHLAHTCMRGSEKHKAEKPLDLMLDLVSWFSDVGDVVLDPFAGSGTTGLASHLLKRDFKGTELDPIWASRAKVRASSDALSDRDAGQYEKWRESKRVFDIDKARRDAHTAKVRAKMDAKKAVGG